MFNKLILVGNLTRDIELKYTSGGTAIAKTAIATTRKFSTNGEKKEEVCFVDITFFGRSAEVANQYLRKGSKCLVEGRLSFEQWTDQQGQKRSKHSVIVEAMQMLDTKADGQRPSHNEPQSEPSVTHEYVNDGMQPSYGVDQSDQEPAPDYGQVAEDKATKPYTPQQSILDYDVDEDEIPF